MGKHDNKRDRHSKKHSGKINHRQSVGSGTSRHWVGWAALAVVLVAGVGIAWTLLKEESPRIAASTPVTKLPESVLPKNLETRPAESKPVPPPAAPRLDIPEPEFDFGFVPQNAKISHVFWLHSAGTDTLKIIKVNPG
jgi:hypothetical protein